MSAHKRDKTESPFLQTYSTKMRICMQAVACKHADDTSHSRGKEIWIVAKKKRHLENDPGEEVSRQ